MFNEIWLFTLLCTRQTHRAWFLLKSASSKNKFTGRHVLIHWLQSPNRLVFGLTAKHSMLMVGREAALEILKT